MRPLQVQLLHAPTLLRTQAVYCACLVSMSSAALLIRYSGILPSLTSIDTSCRLSQHADSLSMQP